MKNLITILFLFFLFITIKFTGCTNHSKKEQTGAESTSDIPGLLSINCISCHVPGQSELSRVAPSLVEIKQHYLANGETKDQFVLSFINFMNNPSFHTSKMPDAVAKYGLMPKMGLPDNQLREIAAFLFDADIDSPKFEKQLADAKSRAMENDPSLGYEQIGLKYAMATKSELGKNLMEAIKTLGPAGAVEFCNTRAFTLTDSMATVFGAKIKRVTDKPRNPDNAANATELAYIEELKRKRFNNELLIPRISEGNEFVTGYYPIETNTMCLQCHGKINSDILPETKKKLELLYPTDRATGYGENEVRGIWVVELVKQ